MRLKKIIYKQHAGSHQSWELRELLLGDVNLIVGKNASGKSRALNIIAHLAAMISGQIKEALLTGNYTAHFMHDDEDWIYKLHYEKKKVVGESLSRNGELLLKRGAGGIGTILSEQEGKKTNFQTPDSQLAVVARQDSLQHKFIQPLIDWAKSVFIYRFGSQIGQNTLVSATDDLAAPLDPHNSDHVIGLFRRGRKTFGNQFENSIIRDMKSIGYQITAIGLTPPTSLIVPAPLEYLFVKETGIRARTEQMDMSQGMFRALAILIHLNYGQYSDLPSLILIDDIGEGLDFERSCALIKLIMGKYNPLAAQVVFTTNDRFVMNSVPLQYWSILQRKKQKVFVYNYENSKEIFEEFRFSGLNNFDFFASDFLSQVEVKL